MNTEYTVYQLLDILKWYPFNRIGLLFKSEFRFDDSLKVQKIVSRDYKIAKKDNEEADSYILQYRIKAEFDLGLINF